MKTKKRITAFIMVMAMVISTIISTPTQAASKKYYWMSTKTKSYNYVDGAWKVNYTDTITYDSKGRTKTYISKSGSDYTSKSIYSYKKDGGMTVTYYYNGKKSGKYVYKVDKKGRTDKTQEYNAKNKLISTTKYTYDKYSNCTKRTTTYKEKGRKKEVETTKYTYKKKKIVKSVTKSAWGGKSVTEYNNKGIIKKSTFTDGSYKSVDTYNSKGYNTKSVSEDSYYHTLTTYSYDKKGNTKERVETRTDKVTNEKTVNTYTYSRKYDKNKNLTEWVEYCNGEPNNKSVYSGYKKFKITSSN